MKAETPTACAFWRVWIQMKTASPDWRTLFCGDAEAEQIEHLVSSGVVGDVDVLKVGHHGSKTRLRRSARPGALSRDRAGELREGEPLRPPARRRPLPRLNRAALR